MRFPLYIVEYLASNGRLIRVRVQDVNAWIKHHPHLVPYILA